jgi:hypothetical protein
VEKIVPESMLGSETGIEEEAPRFGEDVFIQDDLLMYVFLLFSIFFFSKF